jgi:hypothetical protein
MMSKRSTLAAGIVGLVVFAAAMWAAGPAAAQADEGNFVKLFIGERERDIVWYNGVEADNEKWGFVQHGRVFVTLTDLMRHIGGTVTWGPSRRRVYATREGLTVRVIPGSPRVVLYNESPPESIFIDWRDWPTTAGSVASLGRPARQIGNRTYVPLRRMCAIYGIPVHWDSNKGRAHVWFGP